MRICLARNCLAEIAMLMLLSFLESAELDAQTMIRSRVRLPPHPQQSRQARSREESGLTEREQLLLDKVQLLLDNVEQLKNAWKNWKQRSMPQIRRSTRAKHATKEVATSECAGIPAIAQGSANTGFTSSSGNSQPVGVATVQTKRATNSGAASKICDERAKEADRPFLGRGLDLAERQSPHQRDLLGYEILHSRNPSRHRLCR